MRKLMLLASVLALIGTPAANATTFNWSYTGPGINNGAAHSRQLKTALRRVSLPSS
jgi:hypothetical protein